MQGTNAIGNQAVLSPIASSDGVARAGGGHGNLVFLAVLFLGKERFYIA
jgi:hypothetical protein